MWAQKDCFREKMVSELVLVILTCFQLTLTVDPAAFNYVDLKDRQPDDVPQRWYRSLHAPAARYLVDEGQSNLSSFSPSLRRHSNVITL